ncbi:MAG: hypothetical protein DRH70_05360, partial [Candidatus Coatesbacteria bacterium]
MQLNEKLKEELLGIYKKLNNEGKLLSEDKLRQCYQLFRERFGPEKLLQLDGEALLNTMHGEPMHDNLDFWLEFKDDDELPARFGRIGAAAKFVFGVFRRAQTGEWITAGRGGAKNAIVISV